MGLSKKLGGTAQKVAQPVSNAVPYKWSNQTYTVDEIMKKFKLPCVVQCATDSCTVMWSDFQFDLRQPLLFFSKRSAQKVHAVCLKQTIDTLEEIGPPLAIPQDYEGWFGAAPKGNSKAKRHFRVDEVANSTAHRLLVTTKCPAFTSCRDPSGNLQYMSREVMPGEVLKRVGVMDFNTTPLERSDLVKKQGPCLECLDEKDEDVVIPLSHAVLTYEIVEAYPEDESRVFQMTSLIGAGNLKLPRILNLIHGNPPLLAYAFTGMIRCLSVFTEETILAATLEDPGSRCLELATDSCVRFRLGLNEAAVKKTCEYANAFQICENFGAKFIAGIKVSFTLKPESSNIGDTDVSFCESVSDMQDVEANSEFDIAWGSVKKAKLVIASSSSEKDKSYSADATAPTVDHVTVDDTKHESHAAVTDLIEAGSDMGDNCVPQHHDFTEREIVDLMLKKGLMDTADKSDETPIEMDVLKEDRVTDNPLFYFFQRNPEQPWKSDEPESDESSSEDIPQEKACLQQQNEQDNPLLHLFQPYSAPVVAKPTTKNPLSYLFEQNLDQTLADDISKNKVLSDKNLKSPSVSSNSPVLHSGCSDSDDVSHRVVYKTASVYTGSNYDDDDSDDEEEENDSQFSESDENKSDISELSNDNKRLNYSKEKKMPIKNANSLTGFEISKNGSTPMKYHKSNGSFYQDTFDASLTLNKSEFITSSRDKTLSEETGLSNVSLDESYDVNDLLNLAEIESRNDFTTDMSEYAKPSSKSENLSCSNTDIRLARNGESDSVHRLKSLLEEVSEIVNISSGRILDANKDLLHHEQDKMNNSPVTKHDVPFPILRHIKTRSNKCDSTMPNEINTNASAISNSSDVIAEGNTSVTNQGEQVICYSMFTKDDFRFKQDNLIPRLNASKNEETSGKALGCSHVELNLAHVGQENMNNNSAALNELSRTADMLHRTTADGLHRTADGLNRTTENGLNRTTADGLNRTTADGLNRTTADGLNRTTADGLHRTENNKLNGRRPTVVRRTSSNEQHKAPSPESSISSIFSVAQRRGDRFDPSKGSYQSHNHQYRHSSEIEDLESEPTSPSVCDTEEMNSFPYKGQRILSLARGRNALSSVENFDRLSSTNDSMSSNYSSSLDNSFGYSVPKLVVIGDPDLIIEDHHRFANQGHDGFVVVSTNPNRNSALGSNKSSSVEGWDETHVVIDRNVTSTNGKPRPNRHQEEFVQFQFGDGLCEDYV